MEQNDTDVKSCTHDGGAPPLPGIGYYSEPRAPSPSFLLVRESSLAFLVGLLLLRRRQRRQGNEVLLVGGLTDEDDG